MFVHYDFPPELTADFSQSAGVLIPKNGEVFWLKYNNEILVVASNGHSSPWRFLEGVADPVRND
jgi:hypothetical protein